MIAYSQPKPCLWHAALNLVLAT